MKKRELHVITDTALAELRLNLESLTTADWEELAALIEKVKSRKLETVFKRLRNYYAT